MYDPLNPTELQKRLLENPPLNTSEALLIVSLAAFNEIPRKRVGSFEKFPDTYAIASGIERWCITTFGTDYSAAFLHDMAQVVLNRGK